MANQFGLYSKACCKAPDGGGAAEASPIKSKKSTAIASPNYIPSIIWEGWKNGCKIFGARNAELAVVHYHGCLGVSANEWIWFQYIDQIRKAGGPSIAVIVPQSHRIVSSTPRNQLRQLSQLLAVVDGLTEEQKRYLPQDLTDSSFVGKVRTSIDLAQKIIKGAQQWHEIVFTKDKNGIMTPDLSATAQMMIKAGAEVTGYATETRRSMGIGCYIASGFSLGVGMAAYEAFYREDDYGPPLGVLLAGAPLLRQVCEARAPLPDRQKIRGVVTLYANDPIPQHVLDHTARDVEKIKKDYGLTNILVHQEPGGHELNYETNSRHLASLLNASPRSGALVVV